MADITTGVEIDVSTNAEEAMAKVDGLNESIQQGAKSGKEAYSDFRGETRGLTGDVLNLTKGTAEYSAQLAKLAAHKAEFAELREQMKALDPRTSTQAFAQFGQTGVRALGGIAGAAAIAAGNNEKMANEMLKGFALIQVAEAAVSIGELKKQAGAIKTALFQKLVTAGYIEQTAAINGATIAQGLLNAVTSAWPIALLVAGIAAIAAAVAAWNSHNEEIAESEQKKIDMLHEEAKAIEATKGLLHDKLQNEIDLLTAQGASYEKIAAAKEKQRAADAEAVKEQIEGQQALIQAQMIKNKAEESEISILETAWGIIRGKSAAEIAADHATNEEAMKRHDVLETELNDLEKLKNTYENLTKVKPAQEQKDAADHYKKLQDERNKAAEARKQKDIDNYIWQMEQTRQEFADEKKAEDEKNAAIEKADLDHYNRVLARNKAFLKQKKEDDDKAAKQKEKDLKDEQSAQLAIATSTGDALVAIGDLLTKKGKTNTDAQKALALIQIGIKEAVSIANIMESATANPLNSTTFGAAGIAQAAAGLAELAANIEAAKKILDGGSSGSTSLSSAASSASQSAPQIPSSTTFGASNPSQGANGNISSGSNTNVKAYVLQSDLNESQVNQQLKFKYRVK